MLSSTMQKIGDKKIIYNTIEEIIDPSHTALVVWDVINMFVNLIFNRQEFTRNLGSVIELARRANVPIFFTRHQLLPIQTFYVFSCHFLEVLFV